MQGALGGEKGTKVHKKKRKEMEEKNWRREIDGKLGKGEKEKLREKEGKKEQSFSRKTFAIYDFLSEKILG